MKISTFLDIIDSEKEMLLAFQISNNKRFICDRRKNVKPRQLFKFISAVHLDSKWNRYEENQLRSEIASIPWHYIQKEGLMESNNNYLDFTKEEYEVWRTKAILSGLVIHYE